MILVLFPSQGIGFPWFGKQHAQDQAPVVHFVRLGNVCQTIVVSQIQSKSPAFDPKAVTAAELRSRLPMFIIIGRSIRSAFDFDVTIKIIGNRGTRVYMKIMEVESSQQR